MTSNLYCKEGELAVSREDRQAFDNLPHGITEARVVVTSLRNGTLWSVGRSTCGADCDCAATMAEVKRPTPNIATARRINEDFQERLKRAVGDDAFDAIEIANASEANQSAQIDAAHDHCDANVLWAEAFFAMTGSDFNTQDAEQMAMMNLASLLWRNGDADSEAASRE